MLISIDTYRTYNLPGEGGPDPIPHVDLHMHSFFRVLSCFLNPIHVTTLKHTVPRCRCGEVGKTLVL